MSRFYFCHITIIFTSAIIPIIKVYGSFSGIMILGYDYSHQFLACYNLFSFDGGEYEEERTDNELNQPFVKRIELTIAVK
jgi:hypothetical protein